MTQRIESPDPSSESLVVYSAEPAQRGAVGRAWRWGYMAICLLAIAAAIVIARGGASNAELGLAKAVIDAAPVLQDICTASGGQLPSQTDHACPYLQGGPARDSGAC